MVRTGFKSRLHGHMRRMEEAGDQDTKIKAQGRAALAIREHVAESGGALEFAARVAEGAPQDEELKQRSEDFHIGYVTAAHLIAYVLRCMKNGTEVDAAEFEKIREEACASALVKRASGAI